MNANNQTLSLAKKFFWVVGVAFLIRTALFLIAGPVDRYAILSDSDGYITLASNLKNHGLFVKFFDSVPTIETSRTPGYPFFLSLFVSGENFWTQGVIWAQVLIGSLTCGLLFLITLHLWGRLKLALLAGFCLAIDFVTVIHTYYVITETLFLLFWVAGIGLLVWAFPENKNSLKKIGAAGLFFGLSSLIRPIGLYFFIFAAPFLFLAWYKINKKQSFLVAILFVCGSILLPGAWIVRNGLKTKTWTFSSLQGVNMFASFPTFIHMRKTGLGYRDALKELKGLFDQDYPDGFATRTEEASHMGRWAYRYVFRHPSHALWIAGKETVAFLVGNSVKVGAWILFRDIRYSPAYVPDHYEHGLLKQLQLLLERRPGLGFFLFLYLALLGAVYLGSLAGFIWVWKNDHWAKAVLLLSPVLYIYVATVGQEAFARYRIPAMPTLFLLAVWGWEWARSGRLFSSKSA